MTPEVQMRIEWELGRLNLAFFHHLDHREYDSLAALLTADGVIRFGQAVTRGRKELHEYAQGWPDLTLCHVVTNLYYSEVTEEHALGRGLLTVFAGPSRRGGRAVARELSEPHVTEMRDRYRYTDEGWRIAEREFRNVLLPARLPGAEPRER